MNPWLLFWMMLKASLFSTGGTGNLPSLHNDLMGQGWATEQQFAESLAVGQVAPGPNGFWVISLGYMLQGVRGALLALLAITIPPLFVIGVERLYRRHHDHPAMEGFVYGLSLSVIGISVVVLYSLMRGIGMNLRSELILAASVGLGLTRRFPILAIMGLAALIGLALR